MNKVWMMSGVALVALMAWSAQPARSSQDALTSQDLLAKAQSEFATKAREAVIQRRMPPGSTGSAETSPTPLAQPSPDLVASPEPAPPPPAAVVETPTVVAPPALVEGPGDKPVVSKASEPVSTAPSLPVAVAVGVVDVKAADVAVLPKPVQPSPDVVSQPGGLPPVPASVAETPAVAPAPRTGSAEMPAARLESATIATRASAPVTDATVDTKAADVAVAPQPVEAIEPKSEPTPIPAAIVKPAIKRAAKSADVKARPQAIVTRKTRYASIHPATSHTLHHYRAIVSTEPAPRNMERLRARAPEIADMIGRYMSRR